MTTEKATAAIEHMNETQRYCVKHCGLDWPSLSAGWGPSAKVLERLGVIEGRRGRYRLTADLGREVARLLSGT
jgi:hypothetical protein